MQIKEQSTVQGGILLNNKTEEQHQRYVDTQTPVGIKNGGVKREFHQTEAKPHQPPLMPMSEAKQHNDINYENKGNQPATKGSEHYTTAQEEAKKNESKPKDQQQTNENQKGNSRDDDGGI